MFRNRGNPVRAGVIGVGVMGERHARVFGQLDGVELVGVFDPNQERADSIAQAHGGRPFDDLEAFFGAVDAVSIASPTWTHASLALRALDRGLQILIEKPIASGVDEARQVIERAAESPDRIVMIGHIERFNPAVVELRRQLAGRRVLWATLRRMSLWDDRCLDTDVVSDLMIHDIDLLVDLFGNRLRLIDAVGSSIRSDKIDHAIAQFALDEGPTVTLIASRIAERKARTIDVRTADAWICADLVRQTLSKSYLSVLDANGIAWPLEHETYGGSEYLPVPPAEPLRLELEHFIECVRGAKRPLVDAVGGFLALAYAAAITEIIEHKNGALRAGEAIAQTVAD